MAGAACDAASTSVGSDDATELGSLCVITAMGAVVEGPAACICGGVGIPINSLKVAPRLLEIDVSGTNSEADWSGVKPV